MNSPKFILNTLLPLEAVWQWLIVEPLTSDNPVFDSQHYHYLYICEYIRSKLQFSHVENEIIIVLKNKLNNTWTTLNPMIGTSWRLREPPAITVIFSWEF